MRGTRWGSTVSDVLRICNRHKARLLTNLEDAGCPAVFHDAVCKAINWLRDDLMKETEDDLSVRRRVGDEARD